MLNDPAENFDAILGFDANLPQLEKCKPNCENRDGIFCIHRFRSRVRIEYFNTIKFQKWSDLRIFTYFLGHILSCIAKNIADPDTSIFMLVTRDLNFITDVRKEWQKQTESARLKLIFGDNLIQCAGLTIYVQHLDCPNYGHKRADDLRCAFLKVNNFLG